jgi:hypothetical protein
MNFLLFFLLSSITILMTIITVKGMLPQGGCARPASRCGNDCCSPQSTCMSGVCCPIGSTLIGKTCCPKGHNVIGGICCAPSDSCGKACCRGDPGLHLKYICANPMLSLCCLTGRVNCNGTCCGGSCVHGECIETSARCKAQGFISKCSKQKPCGNPNDPTYHCEAGCCSRHI